METIRTRCPSCNKLYSVEPHLIKSSQPEFECLSCQARFFFEYPYQQAEIAPDLSKEVISQIAGLGLAEDFIEGNASQSTNSNAAASASDSSSSFALNQGKQCPKCQAENRSDATECASCGVVFARYLTWKREGEHWQKLNQEVSEAWRAVLDEYDNEDVHNRYLQTCIEAGDLAVAARHYRGILDVTPGEEMAVKMTARISAMAQAPLVEKPSLLAWPSWRTAVFSFVLLIGTILTVTGFTVDWARNLIGIGVSLIITAISARLYLRYLI